MNKKRPVLCVELLKTFSKNELEDLGKILSCEYFNTDRWLKKLLKVLKKYVLKSGVFDDNMQCMVYREVFDHLPVPKGALKKNERSWLNQKLNELMRFAELFLSIEQLKKNDDHKCDLLYPELLARKQYQSFKRHVKRDKAVLDKKDNKGAAYYDRKYNIEKAVHDYLHQSGRLFTKEDNLSDLIENLDMSYALYKLGLHTTALSTVYAPDKKTYNLTSMDATAPLLDLPQYTDNPLIILYRANITLMKTESEPAYFSLLNRLNQYESVVSADLLKPFYASAANFCVEQIKLGKLEYNRKMFELYKIMDDKNLLIEKGFIPVVRLKNVVTTSCRVEEYEWAKNIIERYRLHIRENIRESVYHLNLGNIAFHQKDYETAHREFTKVDKVNKTYDINIKVAILKCLYEKEKEHNDYTMQAFRSTEKFFREDKSLPVIDKKGYINFIKILIKIYRLRHNVNATKAKLVSIKEELNDQKVNCDKRWLLEKIQELEHKIK